MMPSRTPLVPDDRFGDDILTLTPADIPRLTLRNHPRLRPGDAESLVIQAPGLSKWHPESGEFVLVTPWRHREDIPSVNVLSAFRHEDALLSAAIGSARESGAAAFVLLDAYEIRRPAFYSRNRLERLETILTYEHRAPAQLIQDVVPQRQEFEPWFGADDEMFDDLIALDHAAFPWLWHNSRQEFAAYVRMPFVEVWVGRLEGRVTSYLGMTHFRRWSHLDRIAILPDVQGQGLGRETLRFAVSRMMQMGVDRVGLSTQRNNLRSRQMYENSGFIETPELNYDVFGVLFEEGQQRMSDEQAQGIAGHGK
jgi:ribosomal protein S18 acetylase RimI-like enzyme